MGELQHMHIQEVKVRRRTWKKIGAMSSSVRARPPPPPLCLCRTNSIRRLRAPCALVGHEALVLCCMDETQSISTATLAHSTDMVSQTFSN